MPNRSCQLILGSASPRRRELLKWTWLPFKVVVSDVEEIGDQTDPKDYVLGLAKLKARNVYAKCSETHSCPVVLGSDTVVVHDGKVLEKPKNREHAKQMLMGLSGKRHRVYTAVAIVHPEGESAFAEMTEVEFEQIDEDLLELYLDTGESMDKAGAYGIQGAALSFVGRVDGSYSNVVGLPVNAVLRELKTVARKLCGGGDDWRKCFDEI